MGRLKAVRRSKKEEGTKTRKTQKKKTHKKSVDWRTAVKDGRQLDTTECHQIVTVVTQLNCSLYPRCIGGNAACCVVILYFCKSVKTVDWRQKRRGRRLRSHEPRFRQMKSWFLANKMRLPSVSVNQRGADKPSGRAAEWPEGGSISRLQTGVEDFG